MKRSLMLLLAMVLCCSARCAVAQPRILPDRSLQDQMAHTEDAKPVSFRTAFASGTAFFFPKDGSVLAARHALLSPTDEVATEILIAIPKPPLNNIENLHAVAVAQDRSLDLVLLQVNGYPSPGAPPSPAVVAAAPPVAPEAPPPAPKPVVSVAPRRAPQKHTEKARPRRHEHRRKRDGSEDNILRPV